MKKTYVLRDKPHLSFNLNDTSFEIIDVNNSSNNGEYQFTNLLSLNFIKGKTNWLISIISLVTDFVGFGTFDIYKEKDRLVIQLKNSKIEILLFKVDKKEVETLILNLEKLANK